MCYRFATLSIVIMTMSLASAAANAQTDAQVAAAQEALRQTQQELAIAEARKRAAEAAVRAAEAEAAARLARQEAARLNAAAAALVPEQTPSDPLSVAPRSTEPVALTSAGTEHATEGTTRKLSPEQAEATREFAGLKFGAGVSVTLDIGENDRVQEAEVVNGLVRVSRRNNTRARIMLESHYFFLPNHRSPIGGVRANQWGWGPFIALQPGTEEIIEAAAIGLMIGFRRSLESKESFNLGLGIVVDPSSRILADGIIANQPLPAGETEVRFLEREQVGLLLLTSFSF